MFLISENTVKQVCYVGPMIVQWCQVHDALRNGFESMQYVGSWSWKKEKAEPKPCVFWYSKKPPLLKQCESDPTAEEFALSVYP